MGLGHAKTAGYHSRHFFAQESFDSLGDTFEYNNHLTGGKGTACVLLNNFVATSNKTVFGPGDEFN